MLAGDEPDDFTNLAFGIIARQPRKAVWTDLLSVCQLGHIVERRALGVGEKRAGGVMLQGFELGLVHRFFDRGPATNVYAEKTHVDPSHLLANEEDEFSPQAQLSVQFCDLRVEHAESCWQPRRVHFERCQHFAELPARKV